MAGVEGRGPPADDADGHDRVGLPPVRDPPGSHDAREGLSRGLKEKGIETGVHYPVPNHLQPAITDLYGTQPTLPRTEDYAKRILSLPMFPSITEEEVKRVADAVKAFLGG